MSDTAVDITSVSDADRSSPPPSPPPPYSNHEQELPPYPAAPPAYPPLKAESKSISQPGADYEPPANIDPEDPGISNIVSSPFDDKTVRRGFVRKVFCILTIQLLFTFSVVCVFTFSNKIKEAVQKNIWVYVSSYIIFIVVACVLSLCKSFSRRHPWNIVGLVVVTLSMSYMVGTIASYHDTSSVIITMGATVAISLAIIAFSVQTRYDFTICYGIALILAVDLLMFGFFSIFYYSVILDIVYGCLGALLFSLFLMIDCQLLMGRASYSLDPEDYVIAALMLYLDIILIFIYLLGRR